MRLAENIKYVAIAAVCLTVGVGTPSMASSMRRAFDASNADRVDGLHATTAAASSTYRRNKLVATDSATGLLPNDIIAQALDSAKLDGIAASSYRALSVSPQGAFGTGGAEPSELGMTLPQDDAPTSMSVSFVLPPDHRADAALSVVVDYRTYATGPATDGCTFDVALDGTATNPADQSSQNAGWVSGASNERTLSVPGAPSGTYKGGKFTVTTSHTYPAGSSLSLQVFRNPGGDIPCPDLTVTGIQARY